MSEGIVIWGLLVAAYAIGMIVSMLGSDSVINDLYDPSPRDTVKETNKYLKKGKTYGRRDIK